ncbi:MAG TPA: GNAT family N-acetyltransferase, partial [Chthoniobacterales bacterium]|nr:GNAT family N-acetyltransferase [Chthoniobacterales bacterium]
MAKFSRNPTFETCRLRLRTLQPGDEEFLASLDSDSEVMQYIHCGPLSRHAAIKWAKAQIEMAPHRWHLHKWIVEFRDHPIRAGWVELSKFHGVFDPNENRLSDDVSLGYQLAPTYWNKGVATEAARPILAYAFETLELDRVVAFTRTGNVRSARVLEKLGFHQHAGRHHKDDAGNECRLYALWV